MIQEGLVNRELTQRPVSGILRILGFLARQRYRVTFRAGSRGDDQLPDRNGRFPA